MREDLTDIINRLDDHEVRIAKLEKSGRTTTETVGAKKQSVKEFIISKKPGDDVQKTLVIGYFLENNEGMESFNVKDIETTFRKAKEQVPKNLNDKVYKNIQKGYMMDAEEKKNDKKAWVLTSSGEQFVEND
jgi:hypothetical protein